MKGKFKRISLLLVALTSTITLCAYAKAAEVCTTYKNYYFFNLIDKYDRVSSKLPNSDSEYEVGNATYFPAIGGKYDNVTEKGATIKAAKGKEILKDTNYEVCLKTTNSDNALYNKADPTASCKPSQTIILDDFYTYRKKVGASGSTTGQFPVGNTTSKYTYKSEKSKDADGDDVITTYFTHGTWYKTGNNGLDEIDTENNSLQSYISVATQTLSAGSLMAPTQVNFGEARADELMRGHVIRIISKDRFDQVTKFPVQWTSGNEYDSLLVPALYYIEYQGCKTVADTYKVTVNYYYYKDGKTTTEKYADSHVKEGLADGGTDEVTYPVPKAGCEIVDTEGKHSDETGKTFTIQGKDIVENVYYYCENEPTKYNVTINYLSKEDNKKVADSDYINDVNEAFKTTVTPPTVKNCNPDKKTVDVSIKDSKGVAKDRIYNVYYTCKTDASVDTNAKTGDGLIYASIILAFTAIGLGTYYFVVYGKAKKEEA